MNKIKLKLIKKNLKQKTKNINKSQMINDKIMHNYLKNIQNQKIFTKNKKNNLTQ